MAEDIIKIPVETLSVEDAVSVLKELGIVFDQTKDKAKQKIKLNTDTADAKKLADTMQKIEAAGKKNKNIYHHNKYFQSEENALLSLNKAWNNYAKARNNGDITSETNNGSLVTNVLRYANAYEALGGNLQEVSPQLHEFVSSLRELNKYNSASGYSYTVENFSSSFALFKELQDSGAQFAKGWDTAKQKAQEFLQIEEQIVFVASQNSGTDMETDGGTSEGSGTGSGTGTFNTPIIRTAEELKALADAKREFKEYTSDWALDVDIDDNLSDIQKYSQALNELQKRQQEALDEALMWQNAALEYPENRESYEKYLQHQLDIYNKYGDQIDYVRNKLNEAIDNYAPGTEGGMDADTITIIIQLFKELNQEINNIRIAFDKLGEENPLSNLSKTLSEVNITLDKTSQEIQTLTQSLANKDLNIAFNISGKDAATKASQKRSVTMDAVEQQIKAYTALTDLLTPMGSSTDIFQGNTDKLLRMTNILDNMQSGDSVSKQYDDYKRLIGIFKELAKIKGIDLSAWSSQYEKPLQDAMSTVDKVSSGTEDLNDTFKHIFGEANDITLSGLTGEIDRVIEKIDEMMGKFPEFANKLKNIFVEGVDIQSKLKEIDSLKEKISQLETELTKSIEPPTPSSPPSSAPDETKPMEHVEVATEEAAEAKRDFVTANEEVKRSANESKSPLELEAELMGRIAKAAKEAAEAKQAFAKANEHVKDTAEDSDNAMDGKDSKNGSKSGSKRKKTEEDTSNVIEFVPNTESFDEVIEKFDILQEKASQIASIVKSTRYNSEGEPVISYTARMTDGTSYIMGENSTPQVLNARETVYSAKKSKDSYDKEYSLLAKINQLKIKNLTADEKTKAGNQKRIELLEASIARLREERRQNELVNAEYQQALDKRQATLTENLQIEQQATKAEKDKATEIQKTDNDKRSRYARSDKDTLDQQLQGVTLGNAVFKESKFNSTGKGTITFIEQVGETAKIAVVHVTDLNNALSRVANGTFDASGLQTTYSNRTVKQPTKRQTTPSNANNTNNTKKQVISVEDAYKSLNKTVEEYIKLTQFEAEGIATDEQKERLKELTKQRKEYNQIVENTPEDSLSDEAKTLKQTYDTQTESTAWYTDQIQKAQKQAQALKTIISNTNSILTESNNTELPGFDQVFGAASSKIAEFNQQLINGSLPLEKYYKNVDKVITSLQNTVSVAKQGMTWNEASQQLQDYAISTYNLSQEEVKVNNSTQQVTATIREQNGQLTKLVLTYDKVTGAFQRVDKAGGQAKNGFQKFADGLKGRFAGLAQYLASFASLYQVIDMLKKGFSIIREIDDAFTEMAKVSEESTESLRTFQRESYDIASSIGATGKAVQNSAADFMRLGFSLQEASSLAKDANIYANVGDMEIDESTEHMISSIKAWSSEFNNEVEASSSIIDKYNEVGKFIA